MVDVVEQYMINIVINVKLIYGLILVNPSNFKKKKDYTDLTIYLLDIVSKALLKSQKNKINSFDVIIYGRGIKLGQIDISFVKYVIDILTEYFPEKLGNCYIINPSNIMKNLVKIIKSFLRSDTRKRIHLVKNESITELNNSSAILYN